MTRRVLLCDLDTHLERPNERELNNKPRERIKENRNLYISYALTIVRSYILSGEREKVAPLGSFEDWSRLVREPLIWLGCADPVTSQEVVRDDDPERQAISALFATWPDEKDEYSAKEMLEFWKEKEGKRKYFYEALVNAIGDGISAQKVGLYFKSIEKRPMNKKYIEISKNKHTGTNKFRLVDVEQPAIAA